MIRLAACALALLSTSVSASTLVTNVNGIQVGPDGQLQHFRALTISDEGKVEQVIEHPELVRLANITATVDGQGRTLLPGLIDAHGHVIDAPGGDMGLGLLLLRLDLTGSTSLADVKERVRAYAAAKPGLGWILGRGWNQELWSDKRFPNAADVDAVVAHRPVLLARVDGHAAVANRAALKAARITAATPDPEGGRIERGPDGQPTGLLIDNAIQLVADSAGAPSAETMAQALEAAQGNLLSYGVTATADMGTSAGGWAALNAAGRAGRLRMRFLSYIDMLDPAQRVPSGPGQWLYRDRLRQIGIKLYADGALGSRGALLKAPYADQPATRPVEVMSEVQLRDFSSRAATAGIQVAIHAIGDAANARAITLFEDVARRHGTDKRWRIEHFQIADPRDIGRLAPAGIIASMQPVHQTSDRMMAEARLGPNRLDGAYAWRSVLNSGARLAFGSDFPVESPNPFPGLSAAVSRQDINGQPPGGWLPQERVTFEQALAGFTRDAAYAGFAEDKIGSLEPGKWADFILVDRDISAVDPQALARTQVLETWIAGKKVWSRAAPNAAGRAERGK